MLIRFIKISVIALSVFLTLDAIWLNYAKSFYQKHLGALLRSDINWAAALLLYVLISVGIVFFVVYPTLEKHSWTHALSHGAFLGLITYATYDLTNLATIKNWSLLLSVIDIAWGATVVSAVSVLTYLITIIFAL
jgi:uncharacterized membrane protein